MNKRVQKQISAFNFRWLHIILIIVITFAIVLPGCSKKQASITPMSIEPTIPVNYSTYTDELSLFSISYPPEWETIQYLIEDAEKAVKEEIQNINSNMPIENVTALFMAGIKTGQSYIPSVNVVIEPVPQGIKNIDQLTEAELIGMKQVVEDYVQISRIKTTVDGRESSIINHVMTWPDAGKFHVLQMFTLVNATGWCVTCTSLPEDFDKWEEDFQSIVRSLRILK